MSESQKRIKKFKQDLMAERLALCTDKQQAFFRKLFPRGVSKTKYNSALDLIDRTIAKNEKQC